MIIGNDLMARLGLIAIFKRKVLEWDCGVMTMK